MIKLTTSQSQSAHFELNAKRFLSGPAGAGKTTVGVERMRFLLEQGIRTDSILILTPQRTLQEPYLASFRSPETAAGSEVTFATLGGLARRLVDLFWPLAAERAGFAHPDQPPIFLTLETAQYYMAHLVRPLLDEGYFQTVTLDRNRLYSQIIDNLNKAAVIGFPHTEIGARLDAAWAGDPVQRRVYADAQECANRFRAYCLAHNLLDFSLQLEIFWNILWPQEFVRAYLSGAYRHLIYDNVEEDVPRAHDLMRAWLPEFDSALLIYDEGGGYRRFLGADLETGWALRGLCDEQAALSESFVTPAAVIALEQSLCHVIAPAQYTASSLPVQEDALAFLQSRYYPDLLDAVANEVHVLLTERQIPPEEIVIIAPYLSDALRFSLTQRLEARGVSWRSHRPSRSLRDEPASQALLTLAALAHPAWDIHPSRFDVAYALMQSIEGMDLVRAQLLTEIVYRQHNLSLSPFETIKANVQERITYLFGNRYATLRNWLLTYRESEGLPLDHFLRKLFGEVLSQPGFGFHNNFDSVRVAASLIESAYKFRQALEPALQSEEATLANLGREYLIMLREGVIAAQYLEGWQAQQNEAVLIAPAHTFLMMNRPVTIQFWLDAGSSGWHERLAQPLTHPYVLSREWEAGRTWSDADEVQQSQEMLARLVSGLLRRCRERIYLALSELGESGFEQRGNLLRAFQKVL
ncbi:MAG: recombinase family protein [Anaerolineales bacterium]